MYSTLELGKELKLLQINKGCLIHKNDEHPLTNLEII